MRADLVVKLEELLKIIGETSFYCDLHRMEGIMARVRAEWQEQQLKSCETSPQNGPYEERSQEAVGHISFANRCVDEVT